MTVSRDTAPARTEPAVPAQPGRPRPVPAQTAPSGAGRPRHDAPRAVVEGHPSVGPEDIGAVRRAVEALRRALHDGTVHHHRDIAVPARRRAPGVEVVRVWADGHGVEEQRRACRTCTTASAGR